MIFFFIFLLFEQNNSYFCVPMKQIKNILFLFLFLCAKICAQTNYVVEPFSLNNSYSNEIFSLSVRNGVIFISDRRTNVLVNRRDPSNDPLFHLYFVSMDGSQFGSPQSLSNSIPVNAHHGTCTVSADGNEMFFAANDATGQRIYSARWSGSEWVGIQPFAHNRPGFTTTNPSLSRDGTRLFFASDMPGGYGGFDIYVSERTIRGWEAPRNLGPEINTSGNELYPFIQGNGELYFSSTEHGSMGGLDIFSAREINGAWGAVQRKEEPINSTADDISYTASDAYGTNGFFASNRNDDTFNVYSFDMLFPVFSECTEMEENYYTYILREGGLASETETFMFVWEMGDGTTRYGEEIWHTFPAVGQYEIQLSVLDTITNEISNSVSYILDVLDFEQPYITVPEIIEAGVSVSLDASETFLPDFEIDDYYWFLGDGTRKMGIITEHTYSAPGTYRIQLGVIGRPKSGNIREQVKICVYRDITVR